VNGTRADTCVRARAGLSALTAFVSVAAMSGFRGATVGPSGISRRALVDERRYRRWGQVWGGRRCVWAILRVGAVVEIHRSG